MQPSSASSSSGSVPYFISVSRNQRKNKKSNTRFNIDINLLKKIPKILRESDYRITITLWNNNTIIACEPGNTVEDNYGITFDIGTRIIVGYLINLNNGKNFYSKGVDLKVDSKKCTPTVATRARPLRRGSRTPSHAKRSANTKIEFLE